MLKTMCHLRSPLAGFMSKIVRQQGSLVKAFVEVDDVKHVQPVQNDVENNINIVQEEPIKIAKDNYKRYCVHKFETTNSIHINVEELTPELQTVFAKNYLEELKELLEENDIESISFNNVNEDVFRYQLNMQIRRQNFVSSFQRYIGDKGLAIFTRRD